MRKRDLAASSSAVAPPPPPFCSVLVPLRLLLPVWWLFILPLLSEARAQITHSEFLAAVSSTRASLTPTAASVDPGIARPPARETTQDESLSLYAAFALHLHPRPPAALLRAAAELLPGMGEAFPLITAGKLRGSMLVRTRTQDTDNWTARKWQAFGCLRGDTACGSMLDSTPRPCR